jgi:hypothetical protein
MDFNGDGVSQESQSQLDKLLVKIEEEPSFSDTINSRKNK